MLETIKNLCEAKYNIQRCSPHRKNPRSFWNFSMFRWESCRFIHRLNASWMEWRVPCHPGELYMRAAWGEPPPQGPGRLQPPPPPGWMEKYCSNLLQIQVASRETLLSADPHLPDARWTVSLWHSMFCDPSPTLLIEVLNSGALAENNALWELGQSVERRRF